MNRFPALLRKKAPRSGREMPQYSRHALVTSEVALSACLLYMGKLNGRDQVAI